MSIARASIIGKRFNVREYPCQKLAKAQSRKRSSASRTQHSSISPATSSSVKLATTPARPSSGVTVPTLDFVRQR